MKLMQTCEVIFFFFILNSLTNKLHSYCLAFPSRLLLSFTDSEGKIVLPSSTPELKMVVDEDVPAWLDNLDKNLLVVIHFYHC